MHLSHQVNPLNSQEVPVWKPPDLIRLHSLRRGHVRGRDQFHEFSIWNPSVKGVFIKWGTLKWKLITEYIDDLKLSHIAHRTLGGMLIVLPRATNSTMVQQTSIRVDHHCQVILMLNCLSAFFSISHTTVSTESHSQRRLTQRTIAPNAKICTFQTRSIMAH